MKCDEVKPALLGFLFEQLDPAARSEVRAHLSECGFCRQALTRIISDRGVEPDEAAEEVRRIVEEPGAGLAAWSTVGSPSYGLPPSMPPSWKRSALLDIAACVAAALFIVMAAFLVRTRKFPVVPVPASPTVVMSLELPGVVLSDSDVLCRVSVRKTGSKEPVPDARVTFSLASPQAKLGEFKTGVDGRCEAVFHAPRLAPGKYTVVVETDSPQGRASASWQITIEDPAQLAVFADRSAYEPGSEARLFCMLCRRTGPVGDGPISVKLSDQEGRVLFSRNCRTAANGIREVRFPLDASLRPGIYALAVWSEEISAGLDIVVRPAIQRSEFEGSFELSRRHFKPGEGISGRFRLATAWGEAVCGRRVCVSLLKRGAAPQPSDFSCEALTDGDGFAKFAFPAGVGGNDDDGIAEFMLSARLKDPSDGLPVAFCQIFVSPAVFLVTPVEGCARALRGAESELRWRVSRADGSPVASAAVSVRERLGKVRECETDWKGEFAFRQKYEVSDASSAEWIDVTVKDSTGEAAAVPRVPVDVRAPSGFAIISERDSYTAGDTIRASVSTDAGPENVRIELRVAGMLQVAGSMTVKADKSLALFEWPLPGWACGPMEFRMSSASEKDGREAKASFTVSPRFSMSAGESPGGGTDEPARSGLRLDLRPREFVEPRR
jgi:hypothetical protein